MRRIRLLLGLGLFASISLAGCTWTERELRPKPPPAEFKAPPEDDPRYGNPHEYPKQALEDDDTKKTKDGMKGLPGPMGTGGRGPTAGRGPGGF